MRRVDWNNVQEATDFRTPAPGGYIAAITNVEDVEEKEYLKIEWDFVDGEFRGSNTDTFHRAGFWPYPLIRSYKESALGFFKAFKTALEKSNRGYQFSEDRLMDMRRKYIGVVLAEEEYLAKDGTVKRRLYVASTRSVEAIQKGDYKVPDLKKLPVTTVPSYNDAGGNAFSDLPNDGPLPWDDPFPA